MTIQEIIAGFKYHAERCGVELDIPATVSDMDIDDICDTLSMYGEDEVADEYRNRYIHYSLGGK